MFKELFERLLEALEAKTIHEDDKVLIVQPFTHNAFIKYGMNTGWYKEHGSEWDDFRRWSHRGVIFYYIIDKSDGYTWLVAKRPPEGESDFKDQPKDGMTVWDTDANDTSLWDIEDKIGQPLPDVLKHVGNDDRIMDIINNVCDQDESGVYNSDTSVDLADQKMDRLPVQFGIIRGNFRIPNCGITTMEGMPREVGGTFQAQNNKLTSLKGGPQRVGENYDVGLNALTSLEGSPDEIPGAFLCGSNQNTFKDLKGAPRKVGGYFSVVWTTSLQSLEGAPDSVGATMLVGSYEKSGYKSLEELAATIKRDYPIAESPVRRPEWLTRGTLPDEDRAAADLTIKKKKEKEDPPKDDEEKDPADWWKESRRKQKPNLLERMLLVEFDYTALYVEVVKMAPEGFREVAEMLSNNLGWEMDRIKDGIEKVYQAGAYIEKNSDYTEELRNLPGRISIPMVTFNEDAGEMTTEQVEARFDPDDKQERLFISDEWS
jgi:hypothetical protein